MTARSPPTRARVRPSCAPPSAAMRPRTERVLRLHADIREQRDAIAALRSEWAKLDAPLRLQGLTERHLPLKPLVATQYDSLKNLPERPPNFTKSGDPDPIGAMIETIDAAADAGGVT